MEKVSIVLPCYNHGIFVADAIKSILKQTYKEFELFVFDNGSNDNSWKEINRFDDYRIKKIRLKENDLLKVKELFVEQATGKYAAIMHADDIWVDTKLEHQVAYLEKNMDAHVCITWAKRIEIDENFNEIPSKTRYLNLKNRTVEDWCRYLLSEVNEIPLPSIVCEREYYNKYFNRFLPFRQVGDLYVWLDILQKTNIHVLEETLLLKREYDLSGVQNESYGNHINAFRGGLEVSFARYKFIDEMDDDFFVWYIDDNHTKEKGEKHIDIMCRKFLYMVRHRWGLLEDGIENAVRYYDTYMNYREGKLVFYSRLAQKYNFSVEDFYRLQEEASNAHMRRNSMVNRMRLLMDTDINALKYPSGALTIYGAGWGGKTFYKRIRKKCQVKQFIDRNPKISHYDDVPVVSIDNADLNPDSFIVIVPTYNYYEIVSVLKKKYQFLKKDNFSTLEDFLSCCK